MMHDYMKSIEHRITPQDDRFLSLLDKLCSNTVKINSFSWTDTTLFSKDDQTFFEAHLPTIVNKTHLLPLLENLSSKKSENSAKTKHSNRAIEALTQMITINKICKKSDVIKIEKKSREPG